LTLPLAAWDSSPDTFADAHRAFGFAPRLCGEPRSGVGICRFVAVTADLRHDC
jgi:hypothetical protein